MNELTSDNLSEIVQNNSKVIVQYGATWCGVCRIIKPKFKALADATEGVEFYYVDAEKYPESRQLAEVANLPTFAGFVNGKLVKQAMGSKEEAIKGIIDEVAGN